MNTPTPAMMLQIGFDCGLSLAEEAYANMMHHYDCFFLIEDINSQMEKFHEALGDAGFLDCYMGRCKFKPLTIEAAAQLINYQLQAIPMLLPPPEGELPEEIFSIHDVEEGHDLEHILGKAEYEEQR